MRTPKIRASRVPRGSVAPVRSGRSARERTTRPPAVVDSSWAEALGAALDRYEIPTGTDAEPSGEPMRPTEGSILQYTVDNGRWIAELSNEDGDEWYEPVVGWAVVVTWTAYGPNAEPRQDGDESEFQTDVQPMMFTRDSTTELMLFREGVTLESLINPGFISQHQPIEK